ncbi:MAG: hypothetical protein MUO81_02495, partial [Thermoplasmata archaeon]|nr:hypothetical protein [Thermoplasmata archaeon]
SLALTTLSSIDRTFLQLWVAKDAWCSLGNKAYYPVNRTKVEPPAVFLIVVTDSLEFSVIGGLGTDRASVITEAG